MALGQILRGASGSGTKKDCSWGSMDKGRDARAQGAFESSNATTGDREGDETNRAGASAKGGKSRHRPGTSPLTLRCCKSVAEARSRNLSLKRRGHILDHMDKAGRRCGLAVGGLRSLRH